MKKLLSQFINRLGYDVHRIPDPFAVQKGLLEGIRNPIIFDVGAHHGQTSIIYSKLFREGVIYAFEPYEESFIHLSEKVKTFKNIKPINVAFGNKIDKLSFHINASSQTNSLFPTDIKASQTWGNGILETTNQTEVDVITIDSFLEKSNLEKIDILKIDTQGTEYQIIEGAENTISSGKIKVIYTEIITMPTYIGQKELHEVLHIIHAKGFKLHNFYNYSIINEKLRQLDAIFTYSGASAPADL